MSIFGDNFFEDEDFIDDDDISDIEAEFKAEMRENGLVPIIKDDTIFLYRISSTENTEKIIEEYRNSLFGSYAEVTNDTKKIDDYKFRISRTPYFRNCIGGHTSTKEDLYDYYELDDITEREDFLQLEQNKMFIIDDNMEFDKIIEQISKYYYTFKFKTPSKIAEITSFISNYFDLDYIASIIYYYLYSEDMSFSTGTNPIEDEQLEIDRMNFTSTENDKSEEEKISILKSIFETFDIECVYSIKTDEISEFIAQRIFGINRTDIIKDFAEHNTELIYNSEISSVLKKIVSTNGKVFSLK